MNVYLNIFNTVINRAHPDAYTKLRTNEISLSMLLIEWFFTLYTRQFDLNVVRKLWDMLLVKGEVFLFRVSIWIVTNSYAHFKDSPPEELLNVIRNYCMSLDSQFLLEVKDIILPEEKYYDLLNSYARKFN